MLSIFSFLTPPSFPILYFLFSLLFSNTKYQLSVITAINSSYLMQFGQDFRISGYTGYKK